MSDPIVLSYHAVSETWPADLSLSPAALEAQLSELLRRGYRGATMYDAIHRPPGPKTVAVTFDDAYRSVIQLALPVLERLGIPGTVFVPTDHAGTERPMSWPGIDRWLGGPHEHELVAMSWEELRRLDGAGWEIGSHTCSHPYLTQCDDATLDRELRESRERCGDELGKPCRSLAYPYGDHDDRVVAATAAAGYTAACTVPALLRATDPLRQPRIGVYHDETETSFRVKMSPVVRGLRRSPLAPLSPGAGPAAGGATANRIGSL